MKTAWELIGRLAFWGTWPALWVYLRNTRRTRVIITTGDKVLLVKVWLGTGQWKLPGGGMHRGESGLQAALREVREETGLTLDQTALKSLGSKNVKEYGFSFVADMYKVELSELKDVRKQKLEVTDLLWVDKQQLQDLSPLTGFMLTNWL